MPLILFATLLVGVSGAGLLSVRSQDPPPAKSEADDDLFAELSGEGLHEGKIPARTTKVVVLHAPNLDSIEDAPENDLKGDDRHIAEGLGLMLEQRIQYLPQLRSENVVDRVRRFYGRLRHPDVPRAGDSEFVGRKQARLDEGLKTFGADLLFVVSFVPGQETRGLVYRYSAEKGAHSPTAWTFGKPGSPEPESVASRLEEVASALCEGVGEQIEHAPVPRLVASDKALLAFARMTLAYKSGNAAGAWIEYEELRRHDPRCGRAAHYAMEVFLALAQEQSGAEAAKYPLLAVKAGREALKHVPNDTHIRGRMCWIAAMHCNRFEFARKGMLQALKVQPANANEIERYLTVYETDSLARQLEWIHEYAAPKIKYGWVELLLGHKYFNSGDYARGVEWYAKGVTVNPRDFELQVGAGLCGFYYARTLAKENRQDEAREAFADAIDALRIAIRIDPQEVAYVYDYYVRSATHEFAWLPTNPQDLEELFLVQTVMTGLESSSRTWQWDRLVADILPTQKRLLRDTVKQAVPDDELYILKLLARLRLAGMDRDTDDVIHTLWLIKQSGFRPSLYNDYMNSFGEVVHKYEPEPPGDD
ncbi:MAG: hypothetical protein K8I27_03690 [Planctomycetes bacterium]|nr:hypothetical protein [Planctomycetota bacterium]